MTTTRKNMLPPGLVNNLQEVLLSRKGGNSDNEKNDEQRKKSEAIGDSTETSTSASDENDNSKPVVLVTNGEGMDSLGLVYLVQALVCSGLYNVHVCAPQLDKSVSGHSVTVRETITVAQSEIEGATAYEVSGTTVDCVSLALSGALFSSSKPLLVISGINRGSSCGHHMFYSSVVAGAREALICGVPSLSISLNWKREESQESDFKDAVAVCLPLITAAIRDIEKGVFPKSCFLNIEIPTSPSSNKGFKLTKQSTWRSAPNWLAVSANRHPASAAHFMSNQQSLGLQLAQLSRDASAAGAARRITTQRQNVEVESVGAVKSDNKVKKYFRLEFINKEQEDADEDLDFKALDNGFVAVTPISLCPQIESDIRTSASDWISGVLKEEQ
ncbi:5'-nucleotidase SurE-like [Hibiscus syriacus]|uniref:5'-nucleotidase SurE-like n=1 Tax=Hibiscus syriacus TaxID=106335 RepID=UPI001920BC68|nr:5'-nucleotidase SurE-like [Hibiscus syriacus]